MRIEISNIQKKYGSRKILKGINFAAEGGECIGILGGNGCGKSTLLSILAGVQPADQGEFLFDGKDLFRYPAQRARLVGFIPQGTPLIEELSAYDNLLLWYKKRDLQKELQAGVLKTLGIDAFLKMPVAKLSGGMKKRLSIGCAIAGRPPILLLDEPMAALDLSCKQEIFQYIQNHKQAGGIALLVTHDQMELALCDHCYILKEGCLHPFRYTGNIQELVESL